MVSVMEDGLDYLKSTAEDTGKYIHQRTSRLQTGADELLDRAKAAIEKGKAQIESAMEERAHRQRAAWR
jgi:hypothetical protein